MKHDRRSSYEEPSYVSPLKIDCYRIALQEQFPGVPVCMHAYSGLSLLHNVRWLIIGIVVDKMVIPCIYNMGTYNIGSTYRTSKVIHTDSWI